MADEEHEARECMACRGTGRLISNLGGTPHEVACPWCEGRGLRIPGIDAQASWSAKGEGEAERAADGERSASGTPAPAGDGAPDEPPGA